MKKIKGEILIDDDSKLQKFDSKEWSDKAKKKLSEELKKEWEREFEHQFQEFAPDGSSYGAGLRIIHTGTTDDREILDNIKSFISSLLAKQQEEFVKIMKREYMRGLLDAGSSKFPLDTRLEQLEERYKQYIEDNPSVIADNMVGEWEKKWQKQAAEFSETWEIEKDFISSLLYQQKIRTLEEVENWAKLRKIKSTESMCPSDPPDYEGRAYNEALSDLLAKLTSLKQDSGEIKK